MRKLGTLDPQHDYINTTGAFWYLVGFFSQEGIPDSFFERYVSRKLRREEIKTIGKEVSDKIKLLKDEFPNEEEGPHADTRANR